MSDWDEVKATDYLARTIYESDSIGQIGFIQKPRIRVQAISRKQEPEMAKKSKPMRPKPGCK